jgi:hypothetical protein
MTVTVLEAIQKSRNFSAKNVKSPRLKTELLLAARRRRLVL